MAKRAMVRVSVDVATNTEAAAIADKIEAALTGMAGLEIELSVLDLGAEISAPVPVQPPPEAE